VINRYSGAANEEYFRRLGLVAAAPTLSEATQGIAAVEPIVGAAARPTEATAKQSQATRLVELAAEAELFCTPTWEAYASIMVDEHRETWPIRSASFRHWLQHRYYLQVDRVPGSQALQDALGQLSAAAMFANDTQPVFTRIAGQGDAIYLNLADEYWRSVEITAAGWSVVNAPVRFRRPNGMLELPVPQRGGRLDELRRFINATDEGFVLSCAWLVGAFRSRGPYPILAVHGEPGCAKTTTCNVLRALIDPNMAPQRTLPADERDLMITARNSWVLSYDNLSRLSVWQSDAFCKLSTGGGHATRALYTDDGEVIFEAQRPLLLNGIEEIATRGDLADRAIVVMLPTIPEQRRLPEEQFWAEFEQARPRILGALLGAMVVGLRNLPATRLAQAPRMADFAQWVTAAEPGLGWPPGSFMEAYRGNRSEAHHLALEASPIGELVVRFVEEHGRWKGTAGDLLRLLAARAGSAVARRDWPRCPRSLSTALQRIAANLKAAGVRFEPPLKTHGKRILLLEWVAQTPDDGE
jgi:hypothetical protein